jgi:hypothetical protein
MITTENVKKEIIKAVGILYLQISEQSYEKILVLG